MIMISDIHGCYFTLRRLLKQLPDDELIFCGDLVDRGPDSRAVVKFAMDEKISTVVGNHEDMLLGAHGFNKRYDAGVWEWNGGMQAIESWGGKVDDASLAWMAALPAFIERGKLLVSHTGHGLGFPKFPMDALWSREPDFPDDGRFRVFGHTQEKSISKGAGWRMIDTGAAYARSGYGVLTAYQWPQDISWAQKFDESPL